MIFEAGVIFYPQPLDASFMALTDTEIRRSKPGDKAYKLFDGGGIALKARKGSLRWAATRN
jgi:hypothetical protein